MRSHLMEQRSQLSRKYIGTVLAWGSGPKGQLGMGTEEVNPATNIYSTHNNDVTHMEHPAPIPILMNKNVVSLSAGSSHVLALTQTGTVYSWGSGKRPLKWFPSQTNPSGYVKAGADFKITQVVSTDEASFAREAAPNEAIDMIWQLDKTVAGVNELIAGNLSNLEVSERAPDGYLHY